MNYYIIGNGGFAKEVYFLATEVLGTDWQFCGFIDYKPINQNIIIGSKRFPILDEDKFLSSVYDSEVSVFIGIGNPDKIEQVVAKYEGFTYPNLIHPSVVIHRDSVSLGVGNIITAGCVLTVDIKISSFNIFNLNTTVGHDTEIGNGNVFNPSVNISGGVKFGDYNLLGTNATVLQNLKIGSHNIIGASCLVTKKVDDKSLIVGVPGKKVVKE